MDSKKYTPDLNEIRITVKPVGQPEYDLPFSRKSAEQPGNGQSESNGQVQSNGQGESQIPTFKPGTKIYLYPPPTEGQATPPLKRLKTNTGVPILIHKDWARLQQQAPATAPLQQQEPNTAGMGAGQPTYNEPTAPRVDIVAQAVDIVGELN